MTEYEDMVVTHVLTYGYPSEEDDCWLKWHELGIFNANDLAVRTAANMDRSPRRSDEQYRRRRKR